MQVYSPLQPPLIQIELLNSNFRYREIMPSAALMPYIACFWTINYRASGEDYLHRVIPDGCTDIIFDLSPALSSKKAFVAGLMTTFETMNLASDCSLFGIRFYSHRIRNFIRYPISELTGRQIFLEDVLGREAQSFDNEVRASQGIPDAIKCAELRLRKVLLRNEYDIDSLLEPSMRFILECQGLISIQELARTLCYSERHVRRVFNKELGISPKVFLDIIRFQSLLQELNKSKPADFTKLALKYEYYDQSHFIHCFKRLYGLAPNQVYK
jgi:AraC-like DNA-binding protein